MKAREIDHAKKNVRSLLSEAGIVLGPGQEIEITDFGKGNFERLGLALIIRASEPEYASKWLTVLPGQTCPNHYHAKIKETFFIIKGEVAMWMNGAEFLMKPGNQVTMEPGTWHKFTARTPAVIEEVTNRQYPDDSFFEDKEIERYVTVE